jgi:outer membrane protein assembly factor BamB
VFVGEVGRTLYALDAQTGAVVWKATGDGWFWAGLARQEDTLFAATTAGSVYALEVNTGRERWRTSVGGAVVSPLSLTPEGVLVATDGGRVFVLRPQDGRERWFYDTGTPIRSVIAVRNGLTYVVGMDETLRAMNTTRGTVLWQKALK